jgi:hypothetical protein
VIRLRDACAEARYGILAGAPDGSGTGRYSHYLPAANSGAGWGDGPIVHAFSDAGLGAGEYADGNGFEENLGCEHYGLACARGSGRGSMILGVEALE